MKTLITRFFSVSAGTSDSGYVVDDIKINKGFWSALVPENEIVIPPGHMLVIEVDDRGVISMFRATKDSARD